MAEEQDYTVIAVVGAAALLGVGMWALTRKKDEDDGGGGGDEIASLIGTIRDDYTNQPLSGVTITVGTRVTYSNAQGNYSISDLPVGAVQILATKSGYDQVTINKTLVDGENTANFDMIARVTLQGIVRDSVTNTPLAGVAIAIGDDLLTTSGSGQYSIIVPSGQYSVRASKDGYITQTQAITVMPPAAILNFELVQTFEEEGVVQGRIQNSTNGNAISGAIIQIGSQQIASDGLGYYTLDVPSGTYPITVSASGYITQTRSFTVRTGTINTVNFDMVPVAIPPGTMTGQVTDSANGQPIGGADVWLNETAPGGAYRHVVTSSNGWYSIATVDPGTYTVTAEKIGYATQNKTGVVVSHSNTVVSFALVPSAVNKGFLISLEYDPTYYPNAAFWWGEVNGITTGRYLDALDEFDLWDRRGFDLTTRTWPSNMVIELYNSGSHLIIRKTLSVTLQNGHAYQFYMGIPGQSPQLIDLGLY